MAFSDDVKAADEEIDRGYLDLVVKAYKPLFMAVGEKAKAHMVSEGIKELDLGIRTNHGLVFHDDGNFYDFNIRLVDLAKFPKIYQDEEEYTAGLADNRSFIRPSVHSAMTSALNSFREKVKKSITDYL